MSTQIYLSRTSHTPRPEAISMRFKSVCLLLAVVALVVTSGCTGLQRWKQQGFKVGPDYGTPPAPVADTWIDYENPNVDSVPTDYSYWWSVFGDSTLNQLVDTASQQNLSLQTAGMRILQARARLGIARDNHVYCFYEKSG